VSYIQYRGQVVDSTALAICLKKRPAKCIHLEDHEREALEADLADYERRVWGTMTEQERYDFRRGWEYLLGRIVGPRYTTAEWQDAYLTGGEEAAERIIDLATGID